MKTPLRLERDPIVECSFELRFQSDVAAPSDTLLAALSPELKGEFQEVVRMPLADLQDFSALPPALQHQPRVALQGNQYGLFIGDRVTVLTCYRPYVGWKAYREKILSVLAEVRASGVARQIDRHSIKYVNIIPGKEIEEQFRKVRFVGQLGPFDLTKSLTLVRSEVRRNERLNIIELAASAHAVTRSGETVSGLLLSVDTIALQTPADFWPSIGDHIDRLRATEREIFFEILGNETMSELGAIWG